MQNEMDITPLEAKVNTDFSTELTELLARFGLEGFRRLQQEAITAVLRGKDSLVLMPTGGGKSLCYQLPSLALNGCTVVVSPLIALMKDQADSVNKKLMQEHYAHVLNSSIPAGKQTEIKGKVHEGETKLIYVSPEWLSVEANQVFLDSINPPLIAIDEAHCVSEWGHDFRPEYRNIRKYLSGLSNQPTIICLTATATPFVQQDIIDNLKLKDVNVFKASFNRPNLSYFIQPKLPQAALHQAIAKEVLQHPQETGIIYCMYRKTTEEVAEMLQNNGIKAMAYHGGLPTKERMEVQNAFTSGKVHVVVATIAFGMGIDKADVRFVIHHDLPKSIENYYQETGRAGRDGKPSRCLGFYSEKDVKSYARRFKDLNEGERQRASQLLESMHDFVLSGTCRRAFVLRYFGEKVEHNSCLENNTCDNCAQKHETTDLQEMAKEVLAWMNEHTPNGTSKKMIQTLLLGRTTPAITTAKFEQSSIFGIGKTLRPNSIRELIEMALNVGVLQPDPSNPLSVLPGEWSKENLSSTSFSVSLQQRIDRPKASIEPTFHQDLFDLLKASCKRKADSLNIPSFLVFSDAALKETATYLPTTPENFLAVQGVSDRKSRKFGQSVLPIVQQFTKDNNLEANLSIQTKGVMKKSAQKVKLIEMIDKKMTLDALEGFLGGDQDHVINELETIVMAGTKLNVQHLFSEEVDEELYDEMWDFYRDLEEDQLGPLEEEFDEEEIPEHTLRLVRLQFHAMHGL
jgi:ATP-dependent DNA helicase RecQ